MQPIFFRKLPQSEEIEAERAHSPLLFRKSPKSVMTEAEQANIVLTRLRGGVCHLV